MNKKRALEERIKRARTLHASGHNCAQSVAMAFDDVTGLDDKTVARLTIAYGGGIGGNGGPCGCVTAMTMVAGCVTEGLPVDKRMAYLTARNLLDRFVARNGSYICRDLKTQGRKPCIELIEDAVRLLHEQVSAE